MSRYTLVYDGGCSVCQTSVDWIQSWDARGVIECVAFQDPSVADRFPALSPESLEKQIHLVAADGGVTLGAEAVEQLFRVVDGAPRLGWLFRVPGARAIARLVYRVFARNRRHFGCGDHCRMPEHRNR